MNLRSKSALSLNLVSAWRLTMEQDELVIRSRKGRALLAYLALSGGTASRETLAALLWDRGDMARARTALRQVVSSLRRALATTEMFFWATAEQIGIDTDRLDTDLDRLMRSIARGPLETADLNGLKSLPRLMSDLSDVSVGFENWVSETQSTVLSATQSRLRDLYSNPEAATSVRLRCAEAALSLDDLDEEAARALMACLVQSGNSAQALRVYGDLHARLAEDLDADPSPATQDLAVSIKLAKPESKTAPETPVTAPAEPTRTPVATVAVLPFEIFGARPTPEYISLGLLDQITCHLASYRAPAVISSNSTRGYLGRSDDLKKIREDLDPTYVVTGSVLRDGHEAAIAVQLVEAETSLVLWAGSFETQSDAIFSVRSSVAESIARTLVPNVNGAELRATGTRPTDLLGPYHLVLRAKDLIFQLQPDSFGTAGELLRDAVHSDAGYAPAHALFAEWYALRLWQGWSDQPQQDLAALNMHLRRTMALAPTDGRSISLMGHCRMLFDHRHDDALKLFDQALTLCPNDAETLAWTVPTLSYCEQEDRAIDHGTKALELSPLDPFLFRNEHFLSIAQFMAARFDEAAELGLSCFKRAPDYSSNIRMTIAALHCAGRQAECEPLLDRHQRLLPDFSVTDFMKGHGLPDPNRRDAFAKRLIAAGLPE